MRGRPGTLGALLVGAMISTRTGTARADEIVQIPVGALLDGRPVSTLTGGVVVPWTTGLDKDDAYMTVAAATSLHQTGPALPDDGRFAANAEHPEVALHFSNAAPAASPQAHLVTAVGSFEVPVPPTTYRKVQLYLTSSYGDAPLAIKMTYADRTTTTATFVLPDWGTGKALPTTPPIFFNLIAGLHKWNSAGVSLDTPSHTITGVTLTPAADRALTAIEITKTTAAPWLTFWGATGIATGPASGRADAGSDAGASADGARDVAAETTVAVEAGAPEADASSSEDGAAEAGDDAGAGGTAGAGGAAGVEMTGTSGSAGGAGTGVPPRTGSSSGCAISPAGAYAPWGSALVALALGLASWRRRRA
jgi:hypothetical protein